MTKVKFNTKEINEMRIIIVNEEVYKMSNQQFNKILVMHDGRKGKKIKKEEQEIGLERHDKACQYVRDHYTPIMIANRMWRDD